MTRYLYITLLALASLAAEAQIITHGPITGAVTPYSARIAVMTNAQATVTIQISADSTLANQLNFSAATSAADGNMALINIPGLLPDTKYWYKASTGSNTSDLRSFMTYPCVGQTLDYVFTFGSCMNDDRVNDEVFDEMAKHNSRFFLQVGDWGYPDVTDDWPNDHDYFPVDYNRVINSYKDKYSYAHQKQFLKHVPVDYVWDDHDFANNNSSRNTTTHTDFGFNTTMVEDPYPAGTRRNSIKGYYNLFPAYEPVDSTEGIFHSFRFGNTEVFMLDNRAARSPTTASFQKVNGQWEFNPPPGHSIMGQIQREWLLEELRNSTATWKFVITGTAFNKTYGDCMQSLLNLPAIAGLPLAAAIADGWSGFPMDQDSLINAVNNSNIDGVIMLSGDTHTAAMDNGAAGGLPEVMAGALSQSNSTLYNTTPLIPFGLEWNEGGQGIGGNTNVNDAFGKITVYGDTLLKLEIIDENGARVADQFKYSCSRNTGLRLTADSIIQILCAGNNSGEIHLSAIGGTGPYNYTFDGETYQASGIFDSLPPGTYHPAVRDAVNCTRELCITITAPEVFSVATIITHVNCNGDSTGAITLNAAGGVSPYRALWQDGDTAMNRTNILAGVYPVQVTDNNGCAIDLQPEVEQPAPFAVQFNTTPVRCNGESNGTAIATATGGTGLYSYAWNNGVTGPAQNSLAAGDYILTLTDANACTFTDTMTVSEPAVLAVQFNITSVRCAGESNGIAIATATGGTGPYSYAWNNGLTGAVQNTLAAGDYILTLTDANACALTDSVTVSEPAVFSVDTVITHVVCNGDVTGSIVLNAIGGVTPYLALWQDGDTTLNRGNLTAGAYTVQVTDSNGCVISLQPEVKQPAPFAVQFTITPVRCAGESNGIAVATATGGTGLYNYAWNNGLTGATQNALAAGEYILTLTDANACSFIDTVTVSEPMALRINPTILPDDGSGTGSVTLSATGGVGPYTYLWFDNSTSDSISGLFQGTYPVRVTDVYGCILDTSVTIPFTVGINHTSRDNFKIYPNPVRDELKIEMDLATSTNVNIQLFDMHGKKVWDENLGMVRTVIKILNVSSYPSGNYFVKISGDTFQKFYKVSINR